MMEQEAAPIKEPTPAASPGRRERKKQETRDRLRCLGSELILLRGREASCDSTHPLRVQRPSPMPEKRT